MEIIRMGNIEKQYQLEKTQVPALAGINLTINR